jgi:hypothetical protein
MGDSLICAISRDLRIAKIGRAPFATGLSIFLDKRDDGQKHSTSTRLVTLSGARIGCWVRTSEMQAKTVDYYLLIFFGWLLFLTAAVPLWKANPYPHTRPTLLVMLISNGLFAALYWIKRTTWWARCSGSLPLFCGAAGHWLLNHHV